MPGALPRKLALAVVAFVTLAFAARAVMAVQNEPAIDPGRSLVDNLSAAGITLESYGARSFGAVDFSAVESGAQYYRFFMLDLGNDDEAARGVSILPDYLAQYNKLTGRSTAENLAEIPVSLIGDSRYALYSSNEFGTSDGYLSVQFGDLVFFGQAYGPNFNPIADLASRAAAVGDCVASHREDIALDPAACLPAFDAMPNGFEIWPTYDLSYAPPPTATPSPTPTPSPTSTPTPPPTATPLPTPTPIPYPVYVTREQDGAFKMEFLGPGTFKLDINSGLHGFALNCTGTQTQAKMLDENGDVVADFTTFGYATLQRAVPATYMIYSDCSDRWSFSTANLLTYEVDGQGEVHPSVAQMPAVRITVDSGRFVGTYSCAGESKGASVGVIVGSDGTLIASLPDDEPTTVEFPEEQTVTVYSPCFEAWDIALKSPVPVVSR